MPNERNLPSLLSDDLSLRVIIENHFSYLWILRKYRAISPENKTKKAREYDRREYDRIQ